MADRKQEAKRPMWADKIWDALWEVHPHGLTPKQLRRKTGLNGRQVLQAADYLREFFYRSTDPPLVYVRAGTDEIPGNHWYIAPSWQDHARSSIVSEYLQQSYARLGSADQLLAKAERAFPQKARRIRKVRRNTDYLREELADLLAEL